MSASVRVVTCAGGATWEAPLVRGLQRRELGIELIRRCVDHGELLGVAMRDRPAVAVIAAELPWLDRDLVGSLQDHGVAVVAVGNGTARALDHIGVAHRLGPEASADELATLVHRIRGPEHEMSGTEIDVARTVDVSPARLVAVWGAPGSPGRTTVAAHLAVEAARRGLDVVLVDGDAWAASVAQLLGLAEAPSVTQAARLAGDGWPQPLSSCLQRGPAGCSVLVGLARSELWPEVRQRAWAAVLDAAREVADLVVVDVASPIEEDEELVVDRSPYRRNLMTLTALDLADEVMLVTAGDPIGLRRGIVAHRTLLDTHPATAGKASVVVNRVVRSARRAQDCSTQISEWTGRPPIAFLPVEPAFERVVWEGRALHDIAPRSPWLRELHGLSGALA